MSIPYPAVSALTCRQIRELDKLAIEQVGIPGIVLMENAGRGVAEFTYGTLVNSSADRVLILCGPGNNGGDGFVVARHLHNAGVPVDVVLAAPADKSTGDAGTNGAILERMQFRFIRAFEPDGLEAVQQAARKARVIVDGLLGTGSTGSPRGVMAALIELANATPGARRIAIDLPSGLDAEKGEVHEPCFRADATVTMVAPKTGFLTAAGRQVVGRLVVVDIGLPRELIPTHKFVPPGA